MLSGVDKEGLELLIAALHRRDQGRDFHEVGTRAGDDDYFKHDSSFKSQVSSFKFGTGT
jgi:hypothetical protein